MASAILGLFRAFWKRLNALPPPAPVKAAPEAAPKQPLSSFQASSSPQPLRYLIAVERQLDGKDGEIIEVGYNGPKPRRGRAVRYGNLFDQVGKYGPYLDSKDTADRYEERVVDPSGPGWECLLRDQCISAIGAGFHEIEWDNPDGYRERTVHPAFDYAGSLGLKLCAQHSLSFACDRAKYC